MMLLVFHVAHAEGSSVVHLTHTTLVIEAMCGASVSLDGHPELAVLCEDCDLLAREAGGDQQAWVRVETVVLDLRAAA